MNKGQLWERYRRHLCACESIGLSLDVSRMNFDDAFFERMSASMGSALEAMESLEAGAIANPDENRMVGHYWLRAPELAPEADLRSQICETQERICQFASDVHSGAIGAQDGDRFENLLLLGIGGSALGPRLLADALGSINDRMASFFCDNTDPDGFDRILDTLDDELARTLVLVISKSGGTAETRNALAEVRHRYDQENLEFAKHAIAVTQDGSKLHDQCVSEGWLAYFPMWDWVGGRTSVTSAVGMLPAALQGFDVEAILKGARDCDAITRAKDVAKNPAAMLALMWHHATGGLGAKDMVVIPYKDRLELFSRYLQQLIMESLGKEKDLDGQSVHQGLSVYGNKGSTDQHAYVQQLRDGLDNFFVTFIGIKQDRSGASIEVEAGITSGDFLNGFMLGTRQALYENGRQSITIMLDQLDARTLGALIALYERAVGFYASLININAYHQPGVEAGKKAAAAVIDLQGKVFVELRGKAGQFQTVAQIVESIGFGTCVENVFHILEHLTANPDRGVSRRPGGGEFEASYMIGHPAGD